MEWKIARSRRLSEEGEDSVKKAKDTFSVCNDSVGCRCSLARGNPDVTRKSGNEHTLANNEL